MHSIKILPYVSNIRTPYKCKQIQVWQQKLAPAEIQLFYSEKRHTLGWNPDGQAGLHEILLGNNPFQFCRLINHARKAGIVLIGGYFYWQAWGVLLLHFIFGYRCVLILDGIAQSVYRTTQAHNWKNRLKRFFIKHCSAFLANGALCRKMLEDFQIPAERIFNQYLSIDLEKVRRASVISEAEQVNLKQQLGLAAHVPVIRYCGRLVKRKRVDVLLETAAQVQTRRPVQLLITGSGSDMEYLQHKAKELHVQAVFTGAISNQEELFKLYGISDILVLPSVNEPWGLVAMEAVAAGIALVVSDDCGCCFDLIQPGRNGYIFPWRDREQLSWAIEQALQLDPAAVRQSSQNICAKWNNENSAEEVKRCLQYLLDSVSK